MALHNDIGVQGELLAFTHLVSEGYAVLEKNWRFKRDELDIIAKKDGVLVFVEVKTRTNDFAGDPVSAVSLSKQKRIIRTAGEFVKTYDEYKDIRFDIIGIITNSKETKVDHLKDAFYVTL